MRGICWNKQSASHDVNFKIELTRRAVKDLKKLPTDVRKQILEESLQLETQPFQFKNKIKRIRGVHFPCYRLRIDFESDSYRLFYGIEKDIVFVLRIISKKDADKIIQRIRNIDFPPE
jgi:mRNA-degrading endonuclease RelE of RelBE toxin-antitoxin system